MAFLYLLLAIVIVFGGAAIGYIVCYNLIQYSKTKIDQAENSIDEILRTRYDLIIRANNLIKASLKEDKTYFKDLEKLKTMNISNFDLDRKLNEYAKIFDQLKQDFKQLEDNRGVKDITKELKDSNERISAGKSYYNKNVTDYNRYVSMFPINMVSKIHRFKIKNYFDNKDMNDEVIDDFKL